MEKHIYDNTNAVKTLHDIYKLIDDEGREAISDCENAITACEEKNEEQDIRLDLIEAKNEEQDTRLDLIEAKNEEQDTRLDLIEAKNDEQDTRLDRIELVNVQQDNRLSVLEDFKDNTRFVTGIDLTASNLVASTTMGVFSVPYPSTILAGSLSYIDYLAGDSPTVKQIIGTLKYKDNSVDLYQTVPSNINYFDETVGEKLKIGTLKSTGKLPLTYEINIPKPQTINLSVEALTTSGVNIADITINGDTTHIFAPQGGEGGGGVESVTYDSGTDYYASQTLGILTVDGNKRYAVNEAPPYWLDGLAKGGYENYVDVPVDPCFATRFNVPMFQDKVREWDRTNYQWINNNINKTNDLIRTDKSYIMSRIVPITARPDIIEQFTFTNWSAMQTPLPTIVANAYPNYYRLELEGSFEMYLNTGSLTYSSQMESTAIAIQFNFADKRYFGANNATNQPSGNSDTRWEYNTVFDYVTRQDRLNINSGLIHKGTPYYINFPTQNNYSGFGSSVAGYNTSMGAFSYGPRAYSVALEFGTKDPIYCESDSSKDIVGASLENVYPINYITDFADERNCLTAWLKLQVPNDKTFKSFAGYDTGSGQYMKISEYFRCILPVVMWIRR